mgnify:CR=1 FL=1
MKGKKKKRPTTEKMIRMIRNVLDKLICLVVSTYRHKAALSTERHDHRMQGK